MPAKLSDWSLLAKNHLPSRDWVTIRSVWADAARGFQLAGIVDLSEMLEPIVGPDFAERDNVSVFAFPGGRVAAFGDAAAALAKSAYIVRTVGNCILGGQPTWASVEAYHFSFISARALLALLGVHFIQVGDSYCVLDVFPSGTTAVEQKALSRIVGVSNETARMFFRGRSAPIEQRAVWTIVQRVIRTAELPSVVDKDCEKLCDLSEGFARARNKILYRNKAWIYEEDYFEPTSVVVFNDDIHSFSDLKDFFDEERDANFAFAAMIARIIACLVAEVADEAGVDLVPTSYGPCLRSFSGFSVASLRQLFETLYRKEGYGANL